MTEEKSENQFIACPKCHGSGKNQSGFSCQSCGGMGVGVFYLGKFFYWGLNLGIAVIELDHLRKKIHKIINLVAYLIGFIGLLSLAFWVFQSSQNVQNLEVFAFWKIQNLFLLIFWIGVVALMFVYYRIAEEERQKHKIKPITYNDRFSKYKLPNNWEELKVWHKRNKIDTAKGIDDKTMAVVEEAYMLARKLNHQYVTPMHLFFSAMADPQIGAILSRLNIDNQQLMNKLKEYISRYPQSKERTIFSKEIKKVFIDSYLDASKLGQDRITTKNFLIPCYESEEILREILFDLEIDKNKIFNVIMWFVINDKLVESYKQYKQAAKFKPGKNMDRAYTAVATPTLNQFAYDLTVAAKWGRLDYCVARDKTLEDIFYHFESGYNGVVLIGPKGVGKETVIDGIAQLMVKEDVPPSFQDKRLVELDASRLISGSDASGAQGRMRAAIDEVMRAGNIILYIKNVENFIGISAGGEQSLDLSDVLAGAVERKEIYCLASASLENYTKYIERDAIGDVMAKVEIKEPEGNQAIQIIESKISYFEGKYKVYFSYNAIEDVINLSTKYIHDKYLPEKAIHILELVAVKTLKKKGPQALVSREDIAVAISEMTGIPVTKISVSESEKLLSLEENIHKRMIGQEEAVKMISASLRRARTDLREGNRPIANFLFLGSTGVGKTELAKTVSEIYFGDEKYMIRVDMSEYQHPDSVKKMIGDAQGAKGYLTEAVRRQPFALVLLDEIEKAHPDILNLFLQVMDDGRLTDGQGRTIDFTNSILIATSNAGALYIQKEIFAGTDHETIKTVLINEHLNKVMRPELINRFDGVIVFEPLSIQNVVEITKLMLHKIEKMLDKKGISFRAESEGVLTLAKLGYDPKFGARPLRRLLQDRIEDVIANKILRKELKRRDTVVIDHNGEVAIDKAQEL